MKRAVCPSAHAVARTASLLQKPLKGGMPEREAAAIRKTAKVTFNLSLRPPISLMYFDPVAWMRTPAIMKRAALKIAWLSNWKSAAESPWVKFKDRPASPRASIMYPIWEAVE